MKATIPKIGYKLIDLADYGGEGHLKIKGETLEVTQAITAILQDTARKDGLDFFNPNGREQEINVRYAPELMMAVAVRCVEVEEEDGSYRAITDEEVKEMPPYLLADIYAYVDELNQFPLARNAGEASKKGRQKPTKEE